MTNKPLDILIVEDKRVHQESAEALLEGHNLSLVTNFEHAVDLLVGGDNHEGKWKKHFDVVLSDLMFPTGRGRMLADKSISWDEVGFGYAIPFIAAREGIPNIAVVTDMNHHQHPLAYTMDFLKASGKTGPIAYRFKLNDSQVMFFDIRKLPRIYQLKDRTFTEERAYELSKEQREERFVLDDKGDPVEAKNWKAALDSLLGKDFAFGKEDKD